MTTRRLDGKVDSKCSCASDADDIATDAELRRRKVIRRILRCLPSLVLFVSLQIDGKGIDFSGDQLLSNVVQRTCVCDRFDETARARTWFSRREVACLHYGAVA